MMFVVVIGHFLQFCVKFTVDMNSSGATAAILSSNEFFRDFSARSMDYFVL